MDRIDALVDEFFGVSYKKTSEEIDALLALSGRVVLKQAKDGLWWAFFKAGAVPHHSRCIGTGVNSHHAKADLLDNVLDNEGG
jgi:hypothetical protein